MSVDHNDPEPGAPDGATALLARAAGVEARAERRLAAAASDLACVEGGRLDDQLRAAIWTTLARLIGAIDADIRHHAERASAGHGAPLAARRVVMERVAAAGVFDDAAMLAELMARTWNEVIAAQLPAVAPDDGDRASLLPRLVMGTDRVAAAAATAVMAADARRRAATDDAGRNDLPAELHHLLIWWVAAALRPPAAGAATDAALIDAARRALAAHDEGARLEAAAQRLAAALDPAPSEIGDLLIETLADRQLSLFTALLSQALGVDPDLARAMTLDPDGARLWLALRALDLPRAAVAAIGLALCEADRRRDADRFAAQIDVIMAVSPDVAMAALAEIKLPADYRAARRALERGQ